MTAQDVLTHVRAAGSGSSEVIHTLNGVTDEHEHYRVETTSAHVAAWSTKAVSFGAKDWSNDLRLALLAALRELGASSRCLSGEVWDGLGRILDLENALMYNIGLREFAPFMSGGLWFRRHGASFLSERELAGGPVKAHYRYAAVAQPPAQSAPTSSEGASFSFRAERPSDVKTTWLAAREAVSALDGSIDLSRGRLGLRVEGPRGLAAGSVKPLLDGIVSALHVLPPEDVLTLPTLARWGLDGAEQLVSSGAAPLGPRPLIVLQGPDRPAWNPADDVFDEIVLTPNTANDRCLVEVYRLP